MFVLQEWKNTYFKASTALQFRERKLEDAAQLIENNLTLLGATAIEDRLQDEVWDENTSWSRLEDHNRNKNSYYLVVWKSVGTFYFYSLIKGIRTLVEAYVHIF